MNLDYRIKLINNYMLNEGILKLPSGIYRPVDLEMQTKELYDSNPTHGITLEWENFKIKEGQYFFTLRPSEITLISGVPSSGKSTFLDSIVTHTIKNHSWKWAVFSPESGTPTHFLKRIVENITGEMYSSSSMGRRVSWQDVNRSISALNRFLYILEPKDVNIDNLIAICNTLHNEFGLNAMLLDPYNEMSHTRPKELNETEFVSMMLGRVRKLCQKTSIHFFCVAHPNKQGSRSETTGDEKPPNAVDIAGSMNFYNKADNVLIVHRNKDINTNRYRKVDIHIKKVRFRETGELGTVSLYYNTKTGRLDDKPTVSC